MMTIWYMNTEELCGIILRFKLTECHLKLYCVGIKHNPPDNPGRVYPLEAGDVCPLEVTRKSSGFDPSSKHIHPPGKANGGMMLRLGWSKRERKTSLSRNNQACYEAQGRAGTADLMFTLSEGRNPDRYRMMSVSSFPRYQRAFR